MWRTGVRFSGEPLVGLRPPSSRPTAGSPTSIHIGRGARRQCPAAWSDLLSRREWHALDLYWEVCRPLGGEYELDLWLATPDGVAGGFGFDSFERDFSERDSSFSTSPTAPCPALAQRGRARRKSGSLAVLTRREREILLWVARGKSNREIAAVLYLAPGTIRKHLDNVYDKLGVSNRAGAVGRVFSIETKTSRLAADSRRRLRSLGSYADVTAETLRGFDSRGLHYPCRFAVTSGAILSLCVGSA